MLHSAALLAIPLLAMANAGDSDEWLPGRPVEQIVQDARSYNARADSLQFRSRISENRSDGEAVNNFGNTISNVLFCPKDGRFRAVAEQVVLDHVYKKEQGRRIIVAFDGRNTSNWVRSSTTPKIPTAKPGTEIEDTKVPLFASIEPKSTGWTGPMITGHGYVLGMTPAGELGEVVAAARRAGRAVTTRQKKSEPIDCITVVSDEKRWARRYYYDRTKMCLIREDLIDADYNDALTIQTTVSLIQVGELWLPSQVASKNAFDGFTIKLAFSDWKVNVPAPDSRFRIAYVPGTRVDDQVSNITYVVGTPQEAEATAIRERLLTEATQPTTTAGNLVRLAAIAGVVAILTTIAAGLLWRRRRVAAAGNG